MGGSSVEIATSTNIVEVEEVILKKIKYENWQEEGREGMCVLPGPRMLDNNTGMWSVAWSKVDNTIVTGAKDGVVKTWYSDAEEKKKLAVKHEVGSFGLTQVVSVSISTAGDVLAASSNDNFIKIWDIHGTELQSIDPGFLECYTVCVSPDGQYVATGTRAGNVNIYSVKTGERTAVLETGGKFVNCLAYSLDGSILACGAMDGVITTFDMPSGQQKGKLEGHTMPVRTLAFVHDTSQLLSGSDDQRINLSETKDSSTIVSMRGHTSWVLSVAVNPARDQFASASSDNTVKIWDLRKHECLHTHREMHSDQIWSLAYKPDGTRFVTVSDDRSINVYDCTAEGITPLLPRPGPEFEKVVL